MKRVWNSKRVCALVLCACMVIAGLGINGQAKATKKKVTSISFTTPKTKTLYLKEKESFALKIRVLPKKATNKKVSYVSSKKTVVKVSKTGKLTAKKVGKSTITVKTNDGSKKKAKLTVYVTKSLKKVKKLTMNQKKATLYVNGNGGAQTVTLKAKLKPAKPTTKKLAYVSSKKSVAKVSSKGVVTAVTAGKATITVYAADGRGAKATCKVTVLNKGTQTSPAPNTKPSTSPEATKSPEPSATPEVKIPDGDGSAVTVKSSNNYRSYAVIQATLPAGVKASDIESIHCAVDSQKALSLRLYLGEGKVASKELTTAKASVTDTISGTQSTTVGSSNVPKTTHVLTIGETDSTRAKVEAGTKQGVEFLMQSSAKALLQGVSDSTVTFSLYAHNIKPSYKVSNLTITTAKGTYSIPLNANSVTGKDGATIQ